MEAEFNRPYKVLMDGGIGEYVEKKSRFIATVRKAETEEEAVHFIEEMKKKYWDASHNCSAFVIGSKAELTRCSDDGEPSGTAGRPMLEVLLGEELRNVAVVVTRYFGGTLLGTGGLVRAYIQAVKRGLENSQTGTMRYGIKYGLSTDYNGIGKIQYVLSNKGISPEKAEYAEDVYLEVLVPFEEAQTLQKELTEITNGKTKIVEIDRIYYIDKDK